MKRHTRGRIALMAAVCLAILAGCGMAQNGPGGPGVEPPGSTEPGSSADSTPTGNSVPLDLVNLWRVSGAEGEDVDTWLRLEAKEFQLWRDCGMISGAWVADGSAFLASTSGASGECVTGPGLPGIDWLEVVTQFQAKGAGFELVGANDEVVATLTVDGAPEPLPTAAEFYAEPPVITAEVREAMRPAAPLAPHLRPATADELPGRWVPAEGSSSTDPHLLMNADGTWTGTDGCNGSTGRWTADGRGSLLTTSGASTLIGCDGVNVPSWVGLARTAGFDGAVLLLFNIDGEQLGSLQRG
ncbi:hypothetical protein GCM10027403_35410 [Arthrobacter tecti]